MWVTVDPRSPKPVFQQLVDGVKEAIAKGLLRPGDRLPSVRDLAATMMLNHNTVAKAYQELERAQIIDIVRARGAFVAAEAPPRDREERLRALTDRMRDLLVEAHYLRLEDEDIVALFASVVRAWREERSEVNR
jgi:GntR family transcriptional regulator